MRHTFSGGASRAALDNLNALNGVVLDLHGKINGANLFPSLTERMLVVKVWNSTGKTLPAFSVLSLDGFGLKVESGEANERANQFLSQGCVLKGVPPESGKIICITQEPAEADQVITAILGGITACKVDITHKNQTRAAVKEEETEFMAGSSCGPAFILCKEQIPDLPENENKEEGTGKCWAYVILETEPKFAIGVLDEEFEQNATLTATAPMKTYVFEESEDPEENAVPVESEETIIVYGTMLNSGMTIPSGRRVVAAFICGHWELLQTNCP